MVGILEQIPQLALGWGTETVSEVLLLVALLLRGGQEPPGPVVGVLAAGLHVEVIEAPVLQLLAEVLNTNLDNGGERLDQLGYLKTFVLFVSDVM